MDDTSHPIHSIEAIDRELTTGLRRLRFAPDAERQYEADTVVERTRQLVISSLFGVVSYNVFLLSDWQTVHDVFRLALIWRLGIVSPIALLSIVALTRRPSAVVREGVIAVFGVFSVIPILVLFSLSESPIRLTYQYGTMIVMMFVTVVQRLQFRYAVLSVCGMLALQILAMSQSAIFNAAMIQSEATFYATSAVLILFAAYMLERETRRSYLLVMRGRLLNEQLDRAAKVDPLTGLWNRRHLNAILDATWIAAETAPTSVAFIILDVDHFKSYNDTLGHLAGDRCLQRIGACAQAVVEAVGGLAFRFGGEEFMVVLQGVDLDGACRVAQDLRQAILHDAIPHRGLSAGPVVTASFGVAAGPAPGHAAAALMAAADEALYEAKRAGRNCVKTDVAARTADDARSSDTCVSAAA